MCGPPRNVAQVLQTFRELQVPLRRPRDPPVTLFAPSDDAWREALGGVTASKEDLVRSTLWNHMAQV